MVKTIKRAEYYQALVILAVAIGLQITAAKLNHHTAFGPQYVIIALEIGMATLIALSVSYSNPRRRNHPHRLAAIVFLLCISVANMWSLVLVLRSLIIQHVSVSGAQLLTSAIAIFLTNIIVYAIWYWEIDSPGFTSRRWTKNDQDFQFTQQDLPQRYQNWQPQFYDYLYLSLTNAVNFAPADTRPVTLAAKALMGSQSLISVFTLALLIARSVSILGS